MQTSPGTTTCKQDTLTTKIAWHEPQLREINHLATKSGTVFGWPEGLPTTYGLANGNGVS